MCAAPLASLQRSTVARLARDHEVPPLGGMAMAWLGLGLGLGLG